MLKQSASSPLRKPQKGFPEHEIRQKTVSCLPKDNLLQAQNLPLTSRKVTFYIKKALHGSPKHGHRNNGKRYSTDRQHFTTTVRNSLFSAGYTSAGKQGLLSIEPLTFPYTGMLTDINILTTYSSRRHIHRDCR